MTLATRLLAAGAAAALLTTFAQAQDCAEGCTPGYWKTHPEDWDGEGDDDFTTTVQHPQSFNAVLGVTEAESGLADAVTLLDAANTGGGGLNALARHTAAALASSDAPILYPFSTAGVIDLYRDAVGAVEGPETVESAHLILEAANEAGCPLSNSYTGDLLSCEFCIGTESDCPCGADLVNGGCLNSTGQGGVISASGTSSHAADDLVLTASQLPAQTPVIWIAAVASQRTVLNDGLLCLAPGGLKIIRTKTAQTSAQGVTTLGPGIVQGSIDNPVEVAEIFPGTTWNFQAFYRDTSSTCGGMANLTNAIRVTFY